MASLIPSDLWDEPTLFAEDSPAKTYPSQGNAQDSQGKGPDSSGTHLLSRPMSKRNGSSWRMSPDYSRQIRDAISGQSRLHWPTQGMAILNGECWIRSSSECPNVAVESSLSQVLQSQTDSRYLLSEKAASGILRRAERRGRTLPPILREALLSATRKGLMPSPADQLGPRSEAEGGGHGVAVSYGFNPTGGTRDIGFAEEQAPTVRVGSGVGIPSPPGVVNALTASGLGGGGPDDNMAQAGHLVVQPLLTSDTEPSATR